MELRLSAWACTVQSEPAAVAERNNPIHLAEHGVTRYAGSRCTLLNPLQHLLTTDDVCVANELRTMQRLLVLQGETARFR